jgi:mannosylglycerate hydrolase
MKRDKDRGYIIPHTHWDREWRYPIWKNRMLLVDFMEELLHTLETDSRYHYMLLDGQAAPIEDYLEMRPRDKDRVTRFIREGRIAVGPWYTLPDLYPLDGECLVRNLLKGIRLSESYGACLKVAYNSFGWGQTAQFPQIYKGFGFDFIICAKKVSEARAPQSEFMWEAPDGTRVLTSRLGALARANFFFNVYVDTRYGLRFLSDEFRYTPAKAGLAIHRADTEGCDEDYFIPAAKQGHYWEYLRPGIERAWACTDDTALGSSRLFLNGCDFATSQPDLPDLIEKANELFPGREFLNAPLEQYRDDLMAGLDPEKLSVVRGELRDGPASDCSGNALASRIHLKQLNKQAEALIIRGAEPLSIIAFLLTAEYPVEFLNMAWKYLFQSHPHDSINGVTQDKTACDVENRLQQALELGQVISDKAASDIIQRIDFSAFPEDGARIIIFNPGFQARSEVVEVCIDTPSEWSAWDIELTDEKGDAIPLQHLSRREADFPTHDPGGRPWPTYTDRHLCFIRVKDVPALGYKSYTVRTKTTFHRNHHYWLAMRKTAGDEIGRSDNVLENEYLSVTVNPNGTFDLYDKTQKRCYPGLHYFEDTGDTGNYWAYYPPYENQTHVTLGSAPRIWMAENGPLQAVIVTEHRFEVPPRADEPVYGVRGPSRRSGKTTPLIIRSELILRKEARRLDIRTTVDNTAENHRLRVAFPSGIKAEYSHAGGHFTVDKRPLISEQDAEGRWFNEMQTLPMSRFVDVNDGQEGLALLSNGITEYELRNDPAHTLYLTLFRAMGNMIVTGWECVGRFPKQKGSQLLFPMTFEYSVFPHEGDWTNGVCPEARRYELPLGTYQAMGGSKGTLPPSFGFCTISERAVVVSCFKQAEDRQTAILRIYNPVPEEKSGTIRFAFPLKAVWETDLNEKRGGSLPVQDGHGFTFRCPSNKILTFELEWEPAGRN